MDYQPQNPQGGRNGGYPPYPQGGPNNGYPPYPYGMPAQPIPPKPKGNGMAAASMVLGIISLASLVLLRIAVPFLLGGIGIILAILSKGGSKKMIGKAKAGMICCITGLCLDIVLCSVSVWLLFALPDLSPELTEEINKVCEEQYGISYDEMMEEIYDLWDINQFQ